MSIKKIGSVGIWDIGRDDEGDVCLLLDASDDDSATFYLSVAGLYTLDQTLDQIRAACSDPRAAVIAAARRAVESDFDQEDTYALTQAVERLEDQECDDDAS